MNRRIHSKWLVTPGLTLAVFCYFATPTAVAQVGTCAPAIGEAYLDINNVRARILNNGGLFYRGEPHIYEVPKGGGASALFNGGIWVGGLVDDELRVASSRYGPWEFWAGPLDDDGNPPADCSIFDRVWKVSAVDVDLYDDGGEPTTDLVAWPTGLGAPTLAPADNDSADNNGDGHVDEPGEMKEIHQEILQQPLSQRINRLIDLAAGERPALIGDQMLWWIMNDRGNMHNHSDTPPIGLEVHGMAFAFDQPGHIGNTTFYKLNLQYKGDDPFEAAYVTLWADPDLGDWDDDYVGSDTTLGMGFVYNGDNVDGSMQGYGEAPPALGHDFLQGPIVPSIGDTALVSGVVKPDYRNLAMTSFMKVYGGSGFFSDPGDGLSVYNFMQGRWKDGSPILPYGYGFIPDADRPNPPETTVMFPGDPVAGEFWSEVNSDGQGTSIEPSDRRFAMSSGPFTIEQGDHQEIIYGIVWARGADHLDSITWLREADQLAQALADANFERPAEPDAPMVELTPLDGQVDIAWGNGPGSNNFLDSYREANPFSANSPDYVFEGYEIHQFASPQDEDGELIAVYDVENGVTRVLEDVDSDGFPAYTAFGSDSGVQHVHRVSGLTNYESYHFGVRAYAHSAGANPLILHGPFTRASVIPATHSSVISGEGLEAESSREEPDVAARQTAGISEGSVSVDVVNAALVRGCDYRVEFYALPDGPTTYDVYCDDEKVLDGSASGEPAPQRENVFVSDGLEFSVLGPSVGFKSFETVANAAGPLDPPDLAAFTFNASGFPNPFNLGAQSSESGNTVGAPVIGYQQLTGDGRWGFHAGGAFRFYGPDSGSDTFLGRATRNGVNLEVIGNYDYEMRFTAAGGQAYTHFDSSSVVLSVPFELWRIGIATPDDPSDDVRLIPLLCETCDGGTDPGVYDIGGDHGVSGGADDPASDWIYWYEAADLTPGQAGYDAFFASEDTELLGEEIFAHMVLVGLNAGEAPPYVMDLPEEGTVFRIRTTKPLQPGDVFEFSMGTLAARAPSLDEQKARLADIGITPNPYKGASAYEVNRFRDEVRFTNLPDVATIRVFTLNGSLLRTIKKDSPGNRSLSWDLTNDANLPLASGMYLIHVDVPGVGEQVIKFGVVMASFLW